MQLYDELDATGAVVRRGFTLSSRAELTPGHRWVPHVPPTPTTEQVQARFTTLIQVRLDAFARTRGYDSMSSLCTYATDPDPRFGPEGQRGVLLRGQTWTAAYVILGEVLAGQRPTPQSLADFEGDLPALTWEDAPTE
jgi:hypothetical protein